MSPKPLADWLRQAFGEHWTTRTVATTDDDGLACFRGFFGAYTLRATPASGGCLAGTCMLARRGAREIDVKVD